MRGCRRERIYLAAVLTAVVVCGGLTPLFGQEFTATYAPADPAYASPADAYPATTEAPVISRAAFNADEPPADWESWKAEVDAKLQAIAEKEAAAKKKAAARPSVTAGGRIMFDVATFGEDLASPFTSGVGNGAEFRRARIFLKGNAFDVMDYKIQFDFADTEGGTAADPMNIPGFRDVYLTVKELPLLGHVRVGHFKEPFGLEEMTSSRYITFMERSLVAAFSLARNVGVMAFDHSDSENMTWALGAFASEIADDPPFVRDDNGNMAVTGRVTFLPWYDEATEGRGLLHLGVAFSQREIGDGSVRFSERPEAHLYDRVVDTGGITASDLQLFGAELAFVYGPFSVQSEYMLASVDQPVGTDVDLNGFYIYTSYFLTGENRQYKRTAGAFSRVKPIENFFRVCTEDGSVQTGWGAWEIGYRFSTLDLDDAVAGVSGGNVTDHTIGLNWYLNPYTRLMFNYVNSDVRRGGTTGNLDIFEMRTQIDF